DVPNTADYHLWRLRVQATGSDVEFDRSFDIPVFPNGATSSQLRKLSTEHNLAMSDRLEGIESVLDLQQVPGGVEIFYPPYRKPALKVLGLMTGTILLLGGIVAGFRWAPMIGSWAASA